MLAAANASNVGGQASSDAVMASFQKLIGSVPAPPPVSTVSKTTTTVAKTAQSNGTKSTKVGSGTAQSNAPAAASVVPSVVPGCFGLFGDTTCWGPIGSTTAMVLGGGLLAAFLFFGGHK